MYRVHVLRACVRIGLCARALGGRSSQDYLLVSVRTGATERSASAYGSQRRDRMVGTDV